MSLDHVMTTKIVSNSRRVDSRSFSNASVGLLATRSAFIEGQPQLDPISEVFKTHSRVVLKVVYYERVGEASQVLEGLREVPVVERDHGLDLVGDEFVDQHVVVEDSLLVDSVCESGREQPGP